MTIINFAKEAAKRNKPIKMIQKELLLDTPITDQEMQESTAYQGEYVHNEDRVFITIEPDKDKVTIDLYDTFTGEKYTQFEFDSYTLFLIVETSRRMFKGLEGVLNHDSY